MSSKYRKDWLNYLVPLSLSYIVKRSILFGRGNAKCNLCKSDPSNLASDITNKINISCYKKANVQTSLIYNRKSLEWIHCLGKYHVRMWYFFLWFSWKKSEINRPWRIYFLWSSLAFDFCAWIIRLILIGHENK